MTATPRVLWVFVFLVATCALRAQSFSVFDIDTSEFPIMKAKFYAFDAAGKQVKPLPSEVTVTEDGVSREVISVTCPPNAPPGAISSVLVMDVSGSMSGSGIEIAKVAASAWVKAMPLGQSECALSSFDDDNYFNQDFTTNKTRLLDAIMTLDAGGGTDYDKGLLLQLAGGLEVTKLGKYRKVIVFLTDGLCSSAQVNTIIAEANKQGCQIFVITLGLACPQLLKDIVIGTGGQWFENVYSEDRIAEVYLQILNIAQNVTPCEFTWETNVICKRWIQTLMVSWSGLASTEEFMVPHVAEARLEFSPRSMYLRSKNAGQTHDTTIVITALNSAFTVFDIVSSNPIFDVTPKSFTLLPNESKSLTLHYAPTNNKYAWSDFTIMSAPCERKYFASAYYGLSTDKTLKVDFPNGGESLVAGSDTTLRWSGVSPDDRIQLEFSTNAGAGWQLITDKAFGNTFAWHVPIVTSNTCLVRASQLESTENLSWIRQSGATHGVDITTDGDGNVYVIGDFSDTAIFATEKIASNGKGDIFIAKYQKNGYLEWLKGYGGSEDDHGASVASSPSGDFYVAANFRGSVDIEGTVLTSSSSGDILIAKFNFDGSLGWVRQQGKAWATDMAVDPSGNLYLYGMNDEPLPDIFITKYFEDGTQSWLQRAGGSGEDISTGLAIDSTGDIYLTGRFEGTADFDTLSLISAGSSDDVFLVKYNSTGRVVWAKRFGGTGVDYAQSINVDLPGNMYLSGHFFGNTNIDGTLLSSLGSTDVFVAKFRPDQVLEWVKQVSGPNHDADRATTVDREGSVTMIGRFNGSIAVGGRTLRSTDQTDKFLARFLTTGDLDLFETVGASIGGSTGENGITSDKDNTLFVTGGFSGNATFRDITLSASKYFNLFVWKIPSLSKLQTDTSDAVFSIIMPQPLSHDIDMGSVLVRKMKDSVISSFVSNTGAYQFRVDSIAVIGTTEFQLVSGIPPFTVPANGSHQVEFRFQPTSSGPKSAQIMIITQADTLFQTITGNGIQPIISTLGTVINFGAIETMTTKDTTISIAITNNGTLPVDFTGDGQLGPDKTQFLLLSGGGAFTLQPNESREVSIRFAPRFIGRTSGRIGFDYNGPGSPAILQLFGQGLGGLVKIADDSAYPGEKPNIALTLVNTPTSTLQSLATGFRARVAYNSSVLAPLGGNVVRGSGVDTVTVEGALNTDNTLTSMPFLAALGNAEVSSMDLVEFVWLDAQGQPANYDVETESGTFKVLGVCEEGGKRLFNPGGEVTITRISPNPASESVQVEIETIEAGRTQVVVMDVLGRTIATLYDGEIASGAHKLQLNTSNIAAGSYYLSLQTPTVKKFARVDIAR